MFRSLFALLLVCAGPTTASAQVNVEVDPCLSAEDLRADVSRLTGTSLEEYGSAVSVRIEAPDSDETIMGRIELVVDGQTTVREIEATSCDALGSAAAVMIALALGPEPAPAPEPAAPEPELAHIEPIAPVVPVQGPAPVRPPERPSDASAPMGTFLSLSARLDSGTMPDLAVGFAVGAGLERGAFYAEIGARLWLGQRALATRPGARIDLAHYAGFLRLGLQLKPVSSLGLGSYVEVEAGAVSGKPGGLRIQDPQESAQPWIAARLGAFADVRVAEFLSLRLSGALGAALLRPEFTVLGLGTIFEAEVLLVSAEFSLVVRFS